VQSLRLPDAQAMFATSSKHRRVLQSMSRGLLFLEHAELIGLAEALRHH
jgi:glucokinase